MTATFPGGVKLYSTKNPGDKIQSATINSLQEEVTAIEDFLVTKTAAETIFKMIYPVGAIYISTSSTSPATLFGGTWAAYGQGRVLVGKADSGTFATAGSTGGSETHSHGLASGFAKITASSDGWIAIAKKAVTSWVTTAKNNAANNTSTGDSVSTGAELGGSTDNGSSLQPYVVVYMWRRTA